MIGKHYKIWKKTMATNVDGTLLPIKEVLPGMIKRKFGRIVCISSVAGLGMRPNMITYGTSKAAVHHLTRVQAKRLVGENILVNAIAPGPYESMMLGAAVNHDYSLIESRNPRKRIGSPEDIAGLALFLCSRAGAYTVGAIIPSDGGLVGTAGHDLSQT